MKLAFSAASPLHPLSAGFDAHKKDEINFRYIGVTERDYEWLTEQLVAVANRWGGDNTFLGVVSAGGAAAYSQRQWPAGVNATRQQLAGGPDDARPVPFGMQAAAPPSCLRRCCHPAILADLVRMLRRRRPVPRRCCQGRLVSVLEGGYRIQVRRCTCVVPQGVRSSHCAAVTAPHSQRCQRGRKERRCAAALPGCGRRCRPPKPPLPCAGFPCRPSTPASPSALPSCAMLSLPCLPRAPPARLPQGALVSAFARSVAAHVKALAEPNATVWSPEDARVSGVGGFALCGICFVWLSTACSWAALRHLSAGGAPRFDTQHMQTHPC